MGAFLVAEVPVGGPSSDRCWVDGRRCVAKVYGVGGQEEVDGWAVGGTANELTKEVLERAVHRESPVIRPDVVVGIPAVDRRPKQ